jgi:hypothetical protein
MKHSRPGFFAGSIAGILLCILAGCASSPPAEEEPFWEKILDEVPWEERILGSIEADENTLPDELLSVMFQYGYQYINSTHKKRLENGLELGDSIYELKREYATYDPSDDTFMFIGEFYRDQANIWLIFSKDIGYSLFAEPDPENKSEYRNIRVSGKLE